MENICLVIGNGFDLDFGLKSGYNDFMVSPEFEQLVNNEDRSYLLGKIIVAKNKNRWIDIESIIKEYAENSHRKYSRANEASLLGLYNIDKKGFSALEKALSNYLKRISVDFEPNASSAAVQLIQKLDLNRHCYRKLDVISFNYTNILSEYTSIDLHYVHGKLEDDSIIIGVSDLCQVLKGHSFLIKSHNRHYQSKNVREKLNNADMVIFFGHSLGESDYHYFEEFFSKQSSSNGHKCTRKKAIFIFTGDDDSRLNILWELRTMNNNQVNKLFDQNILDIIPVIGHKDIDAKVNMIMQYIYTGLNESQIYPMIPDNISV